MDEDPSINGEGCRGVLGGMMSWMRTPPLMVRVWRDFRGDDIMDEDPSINGEGVEGF